VWDSVNTGYVYPDFGGLNWPAIREELLPKVQNAQSDQEVYTILKDMVTRLNDGHSYFATPNEAKDEDASFRGQPGYSGIGIRITPVKEGMLVNWVFGGSPSEKAGLKQRDVIIAADGKSCPTPSDVRGPKGTVVKILVRSPGQEPRELAIERSAIVSRNFPIAKRLAANPGIGYLQIPGFDNNGVSGEINNALMQLLESPLQGLILDLRGNGGGLIREMESTLGNFVVGKVGEFRSRNGNGFPVSPAPSRLYTQLQQVPLVVLVDRGTVSAAEVMAAPLQASGRAKVVGSRSAANTESISPVDLFDGSRLWLARNDFYLSNGTRLGVRGVVPDMEVQADWYNFPEDQDPYILQAIEVLKKPAALSTSSSGETLSTRLTLPVPILIPVV